MKTIATFAAVMIAMAMLLTGCSSKEAADEANNENAAVIVSEFKAGTWVDTDGFNYVFNADGFSGRRFNPQDGSSNEFDYEKTGDSYSLNFGKEATQTVTVEFKDGDETAIITKADGSTIVLMYVNDSTDYMEAMNNDYSQVTGDDYTIKPGTWTESTGENYIFFADGTGKKFNLGDGSVVPFTYGENAIGYTIKVEGAGTINAVPEFADDGNTFTMVAEDGSKYVFMFVTEDTDEEFAKTYDSSKVTD